MEKLSLVIDSNEYSHGSSWAFPSDIRYSVRSLIKHGCDYSIRGYAGIIGVERKSYADYVGCLGSRYKGFLKQLAKLRKNKYFCVIVEADIGDPIPQQSMMNHAAIASQTMKLVADGIPIIFAGTRHRAMFMCLLFFKEAIRRIRNGL